MWTTYVALAALVACAHGYSSGAPVEACKNMIPQHAVSPQTSRAPYTIQTSTNKIQKGGSLKVEIKGNSASNTIGGLFLQARKRDNTAVGQFTILPEDSFSRHVDCPEGDAVTHKKHKHEDEKDRIVYMWTAPKDFTGEIVFKGTVAYNGAVFWVGIPSKPVQVI